MSPATEIQIVASLVAVACAILGVFLILRRVALMSDAISHSILFGIVIGFFIARDLHNPLLVVGAALSGVAAVWAVEMLLGTRKVAEDAAIGLVFPVLFSLGVILISRYAGDIHLDVDAVLLGELAFVPFNRGTYFGVDLPMGVWVVGGVLLINIVLILLFYKELKLSTFDAALSAALGFTPVLIHYGLMTMVSLTAVSSFEYVGSVLVVALMIAPPATAYLLTNSLARMLVLSALAAVLSAISGYWLARWLDTNIAGAMATMTGIFFLLALAFAPEQGLVAQAQRARRRRQRFAVEVLVVHLSQHEGVAGEAHESTMEHLSTALNWNPTQAQATVRRAAQQGLLQRQNGTLHLTPDGRHTAQEVLLR